MSIQLFDPIDKTARLDWLEAESYCNRLGGNLASFQNRQALQTVAIDQQLIYKVNKGFWIGLNILDRAKGFQWSDGSPTSFLNWNFLEPNNYNGIEDCAETLPTQLWNDVNCYVNRGWMCKIPKGIVPIENPIISVSFPGKTQFLFD